MKTYEGNQSATKHKYSKRKIFSFKFSLKQDERRRKLSIQAIFVVQVHKDKVAPAGVSIMVSKLSWRVSSFIEKPYSRSTHQSCNIIKSIRLNTWPFETNKLYGWIRRQLVQIMRAKHYLCFFKKINDKQFAVISPHIDGTLLCGTKGLCKWFKNLFNGLYPKKGFHNITFAGIGINTESFEFCMSNSQYALKQNKHPTSMILDLYLTTFRGLVTPVLIFVALYIYTLNLPKLTSHLKTSTKSTQLLIM